MALLMPVALMANVSDANAQRKNYTSHEVRRAEIPAYDPASEQVNIPDAVSDNAPKIADKAGDVYDDAADSVKSGWKSVKHSAKKMMNDDDHHQKNRKGGWHDNNGNYYHNKYKDGKMMNCGCLNDKNCMSNCNKNMKQRFVAKKTADIDEDYNEAIHKINKSGFNADQKDLLIKQTRENRELAVKHVKERAELRAEHRKQRVDMNMSDAMLSQKINRKAVKEVDDID